MDQIWPFWAKNPNYYGRKQKFWSPHTTEKTPRQPFGSFLGKALDEMDQKCPYFAKNTSFGPTFAAFRPKIQFLGGME